MTCLMRAARYMETFYAMLMLQTADAAVAARARYMPGCCRLRSAQSAEDAAREVLRVAR